MIPRSLYIANLCLVEQYKGVPGAVVECGVWRGGMIAGIADLFHGEREYHLFDSFEGLPQAREIDGQAALTWQADKQSPHYLDNCRADAATAEQAMRLSKASHFYIAKGWFENTLPSYIWKQPIAILRLDGDWFDSIMTCLNCLYPHVAEGGLIIFDDYYFWDGCSRAVHQFLAQNKSTERLCQFQDKPLAYLIKRK